MSFYLKLVGNEMFYGGMQSISMDYDTIAPISIILENMALTKPHRLFVIGSAVQTAYMRGRLTSTGLWTDAELQKICTLRNFRLIAVYKDAVHHYSDRGIDIHPIKNEYYEFLHGVTRSQMEHVIEKEILPTRWTTHFTQISV